MQIYWVYDFHLAEQYDREQKKLLTLIHNNYITKIQLRAKRLSENKVTTWVKSIIDTLEKAQLSLPIYINDYARIAQNFQLTGVHLGKHDQNVDEIKNTYPNLKIGYTCHNKNDVLYAQKHHVNYIGCGTIFPSNTKKDLIPKGIDFLKKILPITHIPIYPIGGINSTNIHLLHKNKIKQVALASSLFQDYYLDEAKKIHIL